MIKITDLNYKFKTGDFSISDINLEISENEFVCIIGKNGSGKSTFAKILAGLTKFKNGEISINDLDIKNKKNFLEIRKNISIVFQNPETQIIFDTVYDDMAFPLKNLGFSKNDIEEKINIALKKVDMLKYKHSSISELSLGQKQKIAIATAISTNPKILILDEPTTMLDPVSKNQIYEVLKELKIDGLTIIFITNAIDEILYSDRIFVFENGKIIKDFYKKDLFENQEILKDFEIPSILSIILKLHNTGKSIDLEHFNFDNLLKLL